MIVIDKYKSPDLIAAIETNLIEFSSFFGNLAQAEVYNGPDIFWSITSIPFALFNSVIRARLTPDVVLDTIEAVASRGRSRNVPVLWWTSPTTRPYNLGKYLIKNDFRYIGDSPGMAIDLHNLNENYQPQPELTIQTVDTPDSLRMWSDILTTGFSLPDFAGNAFFDLFSGIGLGEHLPVRHYIGWLKEKPVAVSSLFFGAGVAGIYNLTTIPSLRRQGIGSAMIMKPLREARAMEYTTGVLQASEMGLSIYRRLGFKEYCMFNHYIRTDKAFQSNNPKTDDLHLKQ